ncbi:hypothetical protein [Chryseobacterium koreense]|uniref:Uncharacterized protein n=1 Tax=Chryseobacterium koreense CCUG 49689 TaxID=1304281 RepID=A0A0J7J318_9FLAO|nr:hypothetical protein [Chryseobacterium koreense]KMQ72436.1 hypothetical protein ACM44_01465 [Chryseobacterium koreense CCUG 49689]MBB5333474.1 putative integral membrane protein [Chryseobacterium koreense]
MQRFYKIFLALFIIFIGFNLYVIEWDLGFWHEENAKFILSLSAGILGVVLVLVLHYMSRLVRK